jgi:hypothetical protein
MKLLEYINTSKKHRLTIQVELFDGSIVIGGVKSIDADSFTMYTDFNIPRIFFKEVEDVNYIH